MSDLYPNSDQDGALYLNGERQDEPYLPQHMYYDFPREPDVSLDEEKWGRLFEWRRW